MTNRDSFGREISPFRHELNERIGFLKWIQLHPDDVRKICYNDIGRVFLSPDVHSLHIVWEDLDLNSKEIYEIRHEIADYPWDDFTLDALTEWLESEVGDDSWECHKKAPDILRLLSDYGDDRYIINPPPVMRLVDLAA